MKYTAYLQNGILDPYSLFHQLPVLQYFAFHKMYEFTRENLQRMCLPMTKTFPQITAQSYKTGVQ